MCFDPDEGETARNSKLAFSYLESVKSTGISSGDFVFGEN
jgi:hypothetical protein